MGDKNEHPEELLVAWRSFHIQQNDIAKIGLFIMADAARLTQTSFDVTLQGRVEQNACSKPGEDGGVGCGIRARELACSHGLVAARDIPWPVLSIVRYQ